MNTAQQSSMVLAALYGMQKAAGLSAPATMPAQGISEAVDFISASEKNLRAQILMVQKLKELLPQQHAHRLLRSVHVRIERLWFVVNSSGLLSEPLSLWLQQCAGKDQQNAAICIRDMVLMLQELQWQLAQLARTLQTVLSRGADLDAETTNAIAAVVQSMQGQGARQWPEDAWSPLEHSSVG